VPGVYTTFGTAGDDLIIGTAGSDRIFGMALCGTGQGPVDAGDFANGCTGMPANEPEADRNPGGNCLLTINIESW
jgi:hypothetical protein